MASMIRVRIPTERDLKAINDNNLHQELVGDLAVDVRRALDALVQALSGDSVASLDVLVEALAGLLKAQAKIREIVIEVVGLGGSALDDGELYVALARWIVDNQIGRGFEWDPWMLPQRRA
jgi:hypothetical protein